MSLYADTAADARHQAETDRADAAGCPAPGWPGRCVCGGTLRSRRSAWECDRCETPTPTVEPIL